MLRECNWENTRVLKRNSGPTIGQTRSFIFPKILAPQAV